MQSNDVSLPLWLDLAEAHAEPDQQQALCHAPTRSTSVLPYCLSACLSACLPDELVASAVLHLSSLQAFYYDEKPTLTDAEFDNLKQELQWEGSKVVVLT